MGRAATWLQWIAVRVGVAACSALSACSGGAGGVADGRAPRPNVLVLVGDDVGAELACYGTVGLTTPRLDRLAREGVRFTRAFAPTGICAPSRATLYTGLEPARHGVTGFEPLRDGVATFGEQLAAQGYRTGLLGKLGVKPAERFPFDWLERTTREDEDARDLTFHARQLEAFLDAGPASGDARPFAFVVSFRDAHWPLPTDGAPAVRGVPSPPHDPRQVAVPPPLVDTEGTRAELARYHDALRRLDLTAGALLDVLARRGLDQETLVIFTSDNGPPFPGAKTTLYERGLRQALLVRWPGVTAAGRVEERLVTLADVLPTILDAAGAPASALAALDGRSLVPLLRGADVPWREAVFGFHGTHGTGDEVPARSVRTERWKYVWNPHPEREFQNLGMEVSVAWRDLVQAAGDGDPEAAARVAALRHRAPEELYDLEADPTERVNLAAQVGLAAEDGEARAALQAARDLLRAHLAAQGDALAAAAPR